MFWLILSIIQILLVILFITSTRNLVFSNRKFDRQPIKTEMCFYIWNSFLIFVPFFGVIYWGFAIYDLGQEFLKYDNEMTGLIEVAEGKRNWLFSLMKFMKRKI